MSMEMDGGIKIYLREIARTPLLTREEEFELADRIKKGDPEARAHMIKANLRLVVKIAQDYANYGLPLLDLISEGNMGLMKSVERFDPNKGGKLSTYAAWWIKQSIKRALANQSKTIRLPVHMVDKISKMRRVAMTMSEELGREPTDEELAEEIGIDRAKIAHLKSAAMRPASLDAPISEGETTEFGEIIGDEKALSALDILTNKNMHMQLDDLLEVLDERERKIIDARFGLAGQKPKTLEEVAQGYGVTRERIRQLQNIALKKLRRALEKKDDSRFSEDEEDEDSASSRRSRQFEEALEQGLIGSSRGASTRDKQYVSRPNKHKVVIQQPLSRGGSDNSSLQDEIRTRLLEEKRKEIPTLEQWRSLPELPRKVLARWLGFNGVQFVVENGLSFRDIAAMLYITADEARSAYEEAMIFLERSRAHISLPKTVDEYEHAVEGAGYAETVLIEGEVHPAYESVIPVESPEVAKVLPWWKYEKIPSTINGRQHDTLEEGENIPEKREKKQKNTAQDDIARLRTSRREGKTDTHSGRGVTPRSKPDIIHKIPKGILRKREEAPQIRLFRKRLTVVEREIVDIFWGTGDEDVTPNIEHTAHLLGKKYGDVSTALSTIRRKVQIWSEGEAPRVLVVAKEIAELPPETSLETTEADADMPVESQIDTVLPSEPELPKQQEKSSAVKGREQAIEQKIRELLHEREYRIIEAGFGLNGVPRKTPDELGREFGCTGENILHIQNRALAKIASFFGIPFSSLETLLQSPPSPQPKAQITDKAEIPASKESLPVIEKENQISEERKAEAKMVRAILPAMSGTELAVARRFWGEKEGDPMSSPVEIMRALQMKSSGNVIYYITKIRTRLSRESSSVTQNNGTRSVLVSSTLATKHKQDPLIIALYDPTNIPKLAEDLDMTGEELLARAQMLGMDILCAHISTLESGKGEWLINKDFAHKYDISIEWLQHGKKASELVHEEARAKGVEGSKHFDVLIRDTKYFSPHLQALLLRAYKKQHPSYRIPHEILEQFKK